MNRMQESHAERVKEGLDRLGYNITDEEIGLA